MITLSDAFRHLRVDGNERDRYSVEQYLKQAIAVVYAYIGHDPAVIPFDLNELERRTDYTEDVYTAIMAEKALWQNRGLDAAVLLILGELWANRESGTADPLTPAVKNLLDLYRPVVFA